MKKVLVLFSVWTLAGCAPYGSHYEGFTLVSNGPYNDPNAYARERAAKAEDKWLASHQAIANAYAKQFWDNRPSNLTEGQLAQAQNQMYVDKLYWSIGQVPPELYP
jgi:hypothetical protein